MRRVIQISAIVFVCMLAGLWIAKKNRNAPPVESLSTTTVFLADFTLPDLDDQPRSIMEWSGRPLLINFWATWCAPCRREMPLLQSLQDSRGDGSLQVIGVALDNLPDVKRFVAAIDVTYPILYGEDDVTTIAESFGDEFIGLPFSVFIAPGGEILALRAGELHADDLRELVAEMDAVASGQSSATQARERLRVD